MKLGDPPRPKRVAFIRMGLRHESVWKWPRILQREIKAMWQRGMRGYADKDTWHLAYYLATWLPDAVRETEAGEYVADPRIAGLGDELENVYPWIDWQDEYYERAQAALMRFAKEFGSLWN